MTLVSATATTSECAEECALDAKYAALRSARFCPSRSVAMMAFSWARACFHTPVMAQRGLPRETSPSAPQAALHGRADVPALSASPTLALALSLRHERRWVSGGRYAAIAQWYARQVAPQLIRAGSEALLQPTPSSAFQAVVTPPRNGIRFQ